MELKTLREQKNLTQKEAAVLLGIPLKTYQNYELGRSKLTSLSGRMVIDGVFGAVKKELHKGWLFHFAALFD